MEVPCRRCTDTRGLGKEIWKPISAFTTATDVKKIWSEVLSKGQDLRCVKCQHILEATDDAGVIPCDGCGVIKTRANFNSAEHQLWDSRSADVILCRQCTSKGQAGRPPREDDAEFLFCGGSCQRKLPVTHFVDTMVAEWTMQKMLLLAKCARCVVKDIVKDMSLSLSDEYRYPCRRCKDIKHITSFSAVHMKQWLAKERREETWACFECQFPACCVCPTENRPLCPVSHNALRDGKYYCEEHCYPPCIGCGLARPEGRKKITLAEWRCEDCRKTKTEEQCAACLQFKPRREFGQTLKLVHERWKCLSCQRPSCHKCGKVVLSTNGRKQGTIAYCSAECRFPPCTVCSEPRSKNVPYHVCVDWKCASCK